MSTYNDLPMLKRHLEGSILTISLNNPDMRNALIDDLIIDLTNTLKQADLDSQVRVVILKGEGKSFCAGGDVKAMKDRSGMFAGDSFELKNRYHFGIQEIPRSIERFRKPLLAQVHGAAVGAGCDLVAMCDLRYATTDAKFAETFTKLSLVPGDGGPFFLSRAIGHNRAMEMYLTGDFYSASKMKEYGLINDIFDQSDIDNEVLSIAEKISKNAPGAIQLTKQALKQARLSSLEDHLDLMSTYQGISHRMKDHDIGIDALLNRKEPNFKGI